MRGRRWAAIALLACTALVLPTLLTGCTTTVRGSAAPEAARAGTPAAPPPSTTTPTPKPKRTSLTCAGGTVIRPDGAPYCYLMPSGFTDATNRLTLNFQSANQSQYDSAVGVDVHDVIVVAVFTLPANSDAMTAQRLAGEVDLVLSQGASSGLRIAGDPVPATVDGNRAFRIPVQQTDGEFTSTIYFVFRGFTEVEINCQHADRQPDIDRGCASVRQSIQIVDLPR